MASERHEAPLRLYETAVLPEWVDYNGHMSEAFYALIFGYTTDALLEYVGMDSAFREGRSLSVYTLESHIHYLREAAEAEPLYITTRLMDLDHKRAHVFHSMYRATDGELLSTGEYMLLNVDSSAPKSAPFDEKVREQLQDIRRAHESLDNPEQAGSSIGLG